MRILPHTVLAFALIPLLAACVSTPKPARPQSQPGRTAPPPPPGISVIPPTRPADPEPTGFRAPQVLRVPGLEGVMEQDAAALTRMFGTPRLNVAEGDMRKLQFAGQACVLDIYLYPLRPAGEPVATYLEARRASDGLDVDRRACVDALRKIR